MGPGRALFGCAAMSLGDQDSRPNYVADKFADKRTLPVASASKSLLLLFQQSRFFPQKKRPVCGSRCSPTAVGPKNTLEKQAFCLGCQVKRLMTSVFWGQECHRSELDRQRGKVGINQLGRGQDPVAGFAETTTTCLIHPIGWIRSSWRITLVCTSRRF